MTGAIISVQWINDSNGNQHPPYTATVTNHHTEDGTVDLKYHADGEEETDDLNDTDTSPAGPCCRPRPTSKLTPTHHSRVGSNYASEFRKIGHISRVFIAMMQMDTRQHYYGNDRGDKSKTLAMVVGSDKPPGWEKGDRLRNPADYKRTPIHIPEYHCGDLHRPPGRINFVTQARLLGDGSTRNLTRERKRKRKKRDNSRRQANGGSIEAFYTLKQGGHLCTGRVSREQQGATFRACVCAILLDTTETWAMSAQTLAVLRNAFRAFVRALNFKTQWDCKRTTELLDRLGIPSDTKLRSHGKEPVHAGDRISRPHAPGPTTTTSPLRMDAISTSTRRPKQTPRPPHQEDPRVPLPACVSVQSWRHFLRLRPLFNRLPN